jgi:hypothetical protein
MPPGPDDGSRRARSAGWSERRHERRRFPRIGNPGAVSNARRAMDRAAELDRSVERLLADMTRRQRASAPGRGAGDGCPLGDHHDHVVCFYGTDRSLAEAVTARLGPALRAGEAVIVVVTEEHGEQLRRTLAAAGVEIAGAERSGRLQVLDAAATLSTLLVDGAIPPARFDDVVDPLIGSAIDRFGAVHVCGEMVALLWQGGEERAAIALEQRWNELARRHRFSLFCGYPAVAFQSPDHESGYRAVCAEHSGVAHV